MKLRIRSTKLGKVRFVSHRDSARIWERALRRAGVPVVHTAGFTPRPRISFGLALPTGAESVAEYIDVDVRADVDPSIVEPAELAAQLSAALPVGMDVTAVAGRPEIGGSLQETVTSCTWELWSDHITPRHVTAAAALLTLDELLIERERKGQRRTDDVRPLLLDLRPDESGHRLVAELATIGRALRPAELAAQAFPDVDPLDVRALRTHQWINHDGDRREVISLPAGVTATGQAVGA